MVESDDPVPYPVLASKVGAAMTRLGLGVGEVAKALGVTPEMARRYREGLAMPRPEKLKQLAALLGMTPAELLFGASAGGALIDDRIVETITSEERLLVETYRQLPSYGQKALRARAAELLEHFAPPSKANPYGKGRGTQ